jgi:hypothetical protein
LQSEMVSEGKKIGGLWVGGGGGGNAGGVNYILINTRLTIFRRPGGPLGPVSR